MRDFERQSHAARSERITKIMQIVGDRVAATRDLDHALGCLLGSANAARALCMSEEDAALVDDAIRGLADTILEE